MKSSKGDYASAYYILRSLQNLTFKSPPHQFNRFIKSLIRMHFSDSEIVPISAESPQESDSDNHTQPLNHYHERGLRKGETDRLGRGKFVRHLGKVIALAPRNESIVFALYGKWGEGKSSVLQLLEGEFKNGTLETAPSVIHFNPWIFNDRKALFHAFFEDVGNSLSELTGGDPTDKRAKKWKTFGKAAALIGGTVSEVDKVLSLIGLAVPAGKQIAEAGKSLERLADHVSENINPDKAQKSLKTLKDELSKEMGKSERSILIALDDVDRLLPYDLIELLHLIKALADIPNVHYLILADKERVEANLVKAGVDKNYLEKIVQFAVPLPIANISKVREYLVDGLKDIFNELIPMDPRCNDNFYNELYNCDDLEGFKDLRQVKRFLGSLRLNLGSVVEENNLDLHIWDYLRLQILYHLYSITYQHIKKSSKVFASRVSLDPLGDTPEAEYNELYDKFFNELPDFINHESISILKELIQDKRLPESIEQNSSRRPCAFSEEQINKGH
ncbi:KAP family P-loop NTPase fold protein [Rubritalea tangerina]|uniref:P-loop NTPase fold protein n=1 Tax=Rubritalea tangerina TaxID=430798 RepID=A0ABW4ZDT5_9BACT